MYNYFSFLFLTDFVCYKNDGRSMFFKRKCPKMQEMSRGSFPEGIKSIKFVGEIVCSGSPTPFMGSG